jgi:hypothetical protein
MMKWQHMAITGICILFGLGMLEHGENEGGLLLAFGIFYAAISSGRIWR